MDDALKKKCACAQNLKERKKKSETAVAAFDGRMLLGGVKWWGVAAMLLTSVVSDYTRGGGLAAGADAGAEDTTEGPGGPVVAL